MTAPTEVETPPVLTEAETADALLGAACDAFHDTAHALMVQVRDAEAIPEREKGSHSFAILMSALVGCMRAVMEAHHKPPTPKLLEMVISGLMKGYGDVEVTTVSADSSPPTSLH
jgi:hypothetical protein